MVNNITPYCARYHGTSVTFILCHRSFMKQVLLSALKKWMLRDIGSYSCLGGEARRDILCLFVSTSESLWLLTGCSYPGSMVSFIYTCLWLNISRLPRLGSCCLLWPNRCPCGERWSKKWSWSSCSACSSRPSHHQFLGCTSRWASVFVNSCQWPRRGGGWCSETMCWNVFYLAVLSIAVLPCNVSKRKWEAASDLDRFCWQPCTSWLAARTCSSMNVGSWITHTKWHRWQKSKANFTEIHDIILR